MMVLKPGFLKTFVRRSDWAMAFEVCLYAPRFDGERVTHLSMVTNLTMEDREKSNCEVEPAFRLQHEDAQALMDQLWDGGLRPSEGTGSAGQLASTQKHLEDMRAIAFAKSGVVKPESKK